METLSLALQIILAAYCFGMFIMVCILARNWRAVFVGLSDVIPAALIILLWPIVAYMAVKDNIADKRAGRNSLT